MTYRKCVTSQSFSFIEVLIWVYAYAGCFNVQNRVKNVPRHRQMTVHSGYNTRKTAECMLVYRKATCIVTILTDLFLIINSKIFKWRQKLLQNSTIAAIFRHLHALWPVKFRIIHWDRPQIPAWSSGPAWHGYCSPHWQRLLPQAGPWCGPPG